MNALDGERRREQFGGTGKPETRLLIFNDCDGRCARGVGCEQAGFEHRRAGRALRAPYAAASSANTRSPAAAWAVEFTARISVCASPCASLPPSAAISCASVMRFSHSNSIQTRFARRPRLPTPMNPQPLVRIAPNPRLDHSRRTPRAFQNIRGTVWRCAAFQSRHRSGARSGARPPPRT